MKTILKELFFSLLLITAVSCSKDDDCTKQTWYQDADGDGFGDPNNSQQACTQPNGYVLDNTDFNDTEASLNPDATEICDGIDNDGDGQIDGLMSTNCGAGEVCENGTCITATTYYFDADGDGYGDASNSIEAGSTAPTGYVVDGTDCDDTDPAINPGAQEVLSNNIDEDCDGVLGCYAAGTPCDDGDPSTTNDVEDGNCNCSGT